MDNIYKMSLEYNLIAKDDNMRGELGNLLSVGVDQTGKTGRPVPVAQPEAA